MSASPRSIRPIVFTSDAIAATPTEAFSADVDGGKVEWKTLISSGRTPSDTFTSGIATCAPKGGHLKAHRHTQPEMYYIIRGRGIVSIDDAEYEVQRGAVVFIPRDAEHGIRNMDEEKDLVWLYVFATDKFEDVVYRFSDNKPKARL
ncbi:RmlC-like cupin [Trematosphaeria pertusa]|uniref:RmlC-like cupin n=1 Tax=Trematosphaeria pertusa TaxID=390896 RepID=A0A6A6IRJ3_9PLEO|nr:RmlC-like cupin [Trematosphaeria pertusa]KAF2252698.1 RmlC-like cupin [Trematosphaeria pertusa]